MVKEYDEDQLSGTHRSRQDYVNIALSLALKVISVGISPADNESIIVLLGYAFVYSLIL